MHASAFKFKLNQICFVSGVTGKIIERIVGEDGDRIYSVLLEGDSEPTEFLEHEISGRVTTAKRLARLLKSLGGTPRFSANRYLGTTHDGWDRFEVNQLALDPPRESKPLPPRKEKPFVRVTIQTATKEQVQDALHKIVMKRQRAF
jgi:hypothetical protein